MREIKTKNGEVKQKTRGNTRKMVTISFLSPGFSELIFDRMKDEGQRKKYKDENNKGQPGS